MLWAWCGTQIEWGLWYIDFPLIMMANFFYMCVCVHVHAKWNDFNERQNHQAAPMKKK